ncbi:MAG TPA: tetratricopeptide repeat protein [Candidatus Polarisedimenticolaceae bacterium]|nr:tetratricopeptide repeat protein [Candidatus Polarisedimenticolaceae bacterium]
MRRFGFAFALVLLTLATRAHAQSSVSEILGKIVDQDGKPVPDIEIRAANKAFPDRVQKGTSDKRGNFTVSGLLYTANAFDWTVTIKGPGFVPVSAHVVGRLSEGTLYFEESPKLSAKNPSFDIPVKAFASVRMEVKMRAGDAEAEAAPTPAAAAAAPGDVPSAAAAAAAAAAGDTYGDAVGKVRAGDAEGSVDLFKKAIDEKPDDWERRNVFAGVLLRLDRQGEATIQANKAAQLAPDKAAPYLTLSDIYLSRGLPDKASEAVSKAQQLEPDNVKVLERAAAVSANTGKVDDAIATYEKVLATHPNDTEVMVALAELYNRKKDPKKAEEMLARVRAADPEHAYRTFYNLGVVIENRDDATEADHRKAIEAFREAIKANPKYALAHRDLGFALLRTGDMANARKELQAYVDLDPQARDAADIKATVKSLASAK